MAERAQPSPLSLVARPPFGAAVCRPVAAGVTLAEMLAVAGVAPAAVLRLTIGDWEIEPRYWRAVRPKPGMVITIELVPAGGGGGGEGGGGKNVLGTVLQIAVMVAAIVVFSYAAPLIGTVGAALLSAGVSLAGSLLVSAIAPPSRRSNPGAAYGGQGAEVSRAYSISAGNALSPYAPVPFVLGRHRWHPPYGAMPYTEFSDDDQQDLVLLFQLGYGPIAVTDLRIGDTPLADFDGVQTEIRYGNAGDGVLTLYGWDVYQEELALLIDGTVTASRRSGDDADELAVDIVAPQGLVKYRGDGTREAASLSLRVEYAPAGTDAWTNARDVTLSANQTRPVRRSYRWAVPRGAYDVRIQRFTPVAGDSNTLDALQWTALKTIHHADPIAMTGIAKIAIRLRASERLNGLVDKFNCVIQRGDRNPATAYKALLQGPWLDAADRAADDEIDQVALDAWHTACTSAGFCFDAVIDFETTVRDLAADICAAGRGSPAIRDGKYSVVRDIASQVPVQLFTPRNSWGFRLRRVVPELPQALRVRFVNPDMGWQQDEILVLADGADPNALTRIEVFELFGVTDWRAAWMHGRYHLAVGAQRADVAEISADVEHLVCQRGDLVLVAHDVLDRGLGWGRVRSVAGAVIEVDEVVSLTGGGSYVLLHRADDGVIRSGTISAGADYQITLSAAISAIAAGDLVCWGIAGTETRRMLIKEIEPGPDLTARLLLVDEAPGVHAADDNPPASHTSGLPVPDPGLPPMPALDRPTALRAIGGFGQIVLTWTNPATAFDWIEIWVAATDQRSAAEMIATTKGDAWVHAGLAPEVVRWYWGRAMRSGAAGPWNQDGGTRGATRQITYDEIEAQVIRESHLLPALLAKVDGPQALDAAFINLALHEQQAGQALAQLREDLKYEVGLEGGSALAKAIRDIRASVPSQAAIVQTVEETEVRPGQALAQWSQTIQTTVDGHGTEIADVQDGISTNSATIAVVNQSLNGVKAVTFTKIQMEDQGGRRYLAGFGLSATLESSGQFVSEFGVYADRFWVGGSGGSGSSLPFIVSGGQVYIRTAYIQDLTVDTLKVRFGAMSDFLVIDGWSGSVYVEHPAHLLIVANLVIQGFEQQLGQWGLFVNGSEVRRTPGNTGWSDGAGLSLCHAVEVAGGTMSFSASQVSGTSAHGNQGCQFTVFVVKR